MERGRTREVPATKLLDSLRAAGEVLRFDGCEASFGMRQDGNKTRCSFEYRPGGEGGNNPGLVIRVSQNKTAEDVLPGLTAVTIKGVRRAGRGAEIPGGSSSTVSEEMKSRSSAARDAMIKLIECQESPDAHQLIEEAYSTFKEVYSYDGEGNNDSDIEDGVVDAAFSMVFDFLSDFRARTATKSEGPSN